MAKLFEEFNVYVDDETGDEYVYDGSKLIKVKEGSKRIGDKGDAEFQAKEEAERNAEAANGGVIETKDELEDRLKRIEDTLKDDSVAQALSRETKEKISKADAKKEADRIKRELERFRNDPIIKFEESLRHFLKKQMKRLEDRTYAKFNKRYDDSDFFMKGVRRYDSPQIPTVQVYFDRSASWDESKTKVGRQALATLDQYVRAGKLKLSISYFNTKVFDTYIERGTGGTYGSPILMDIQAKRPDNVIVMTDSDITDCRETVEVPGVVWFLFSGGVSRNLQEHLHGKIATESFELRGD